MVNTKREYAMYAAYHLPWSSSPIMTENPQWLPELPSVSAYSLPLGRSACFTPLDYWEFWKDYGSTVNFCDEWYGGILPHTTRESAEHTP